MIIKQEKATWIPQLPDSPDLGWLRLNGETWTITNIHHYDDYGVTLETFTIEKDGKIKEIYSYDEGETFTFDAY
mgnify:CR=1 FL=1